jgi:transcriptional regulator with XRE-family HTH domain
MSGRQGGPASPFGARLRQWRRQRGLSQLGLAGAAGSTPRHISFLETGRSHPSRQMVLRLAEALGASLREANELLHAAGLPAAYPQSELASPDLAPYRAAIERLLAAHEPYPAMALDARYTVVAANRPSAALFGPELVGSNFVRDALADPATAQTIVNWPEVAWAGLDRLRQDARRSPFDAELRSLISLAEAALDGVPRLSAGEGGLMFCPWFRIGSTVVRTIAMTARFAHPTEVTLDELHIELTYPMDDDADRFFRARHSQARLPTQAQRVRNRLSAAGRYIAGLPEVDAAPGGRPLPATATSPPRVSVRAVRSWRYMPHRDACLLGCRGTARQRPISGGSGSRRSPPLNPRFGVQVPGGALGLCQALA